MSRTQSLTTMKTTKMRMKLLLLHHHPPTPSSSASSVLHHRLFLLLLSLLSSLSLLCLLISSPSATATTSAAAALLLPAPPPPPRDHLLSALLHYVPSPSAGSLAPGDLLRLSSALLPPRCPPCNLLVFGLPHESLLLLSLNHHPRSLSVFLHHHPDHLAAFERLAAARLPHAPLQAYDVSYASRVADLRPLLAASRRLRSTHCRPVQHLLFSDCDLAVNDLPNHLYDVDWDVILVDGPSGYSPDSPGRAPAIFTAAVLARSGADRAKVVDVLVHDFDREVERESSREFLCDENIVFSSEQLAHFAVRRPPPGRDPPDFCTGNATAAGD